MGRYSFRVGGRDFRNVCVLLAVAVLAKLVLVLLLSAVPVADVGKAIGLPERFLYHNFDFFNGTTIERPLVDKLGDTYDSVYYMNIAESGYRLRAENRVFLNSFVDDRRKARWPPGFIDDYCLYNWPFLYPLLIRVFSFLMGFSGAGIFVSNVFSLVAVALAYVALRGYLDESAALKASLLFVFYPYNLAYWTSAFSEPVFMVFVLAAWLAFDRGRFLLSGFFLMLAFFTRLPGVVLFAVFSLIFLMRYWGAGRAKVFSGLASLNLFLIPVVWWMFGEVGSVTGHSVLSVTQLCMNYTLMPGGFVFDVTFLGLFFTYYAFTSVYLLRGIDRDLMVYCLVLMLFHIAVYNTGASIGRYIGVIWPLFVYYGRRLDWLEAVVVSAMFFVLAFIMLELSANMVAFNIL